MDTLAFLGDLAPAFAVRGCQVKILTEPSQFYKELCTRAQHSKARISMAALYLGMFCLYIIYRNFAYVHRFDFIEAGERFGVLQSAKNGKIVQ